ncbi:MAG TPA: hypothetical protein DCL73_17165 [Treponema sp.]|nr:hypothetical protein [Treponema sp.]
MKRATVLLSLATFFLCSFAFVSCASRPVQSTAEAEQNIPQALYVPESFDWRNVCRGIDRFDYENETSPVRWHAVRVDLASDGLELVAFPGSTTDGTKPRVMSTSAFAEKYGCTVAVNTSPFTRKKEIVGIHIVRGRRYAPLVERYCALVFRQDTENGTYSRVSIADNQTEEAVRGAEYAFGGFFSVLRGGSKKEFRAFRHDSRSGAGISGDGRMLYLLVVEGEEPRKSAGLSYQQCADIFRAMGCTDAMEFDGGSSSDLCIDGKSVLSYTCRTVQAASFGFRVQN